MPTNEELFLESENERGWREEMREDTYFVVVAVNMVMYYVARSPYA